VKNADQKSIFAIAREVVELANKVRDGSITRDELMGGTFTITNVGGIGGLASTPIINHPQVAILGVHKIIDKPVVQNGNIVVRKRVMLALSYDHRVIDGADSARFTNAIIGYLANPMLLLAEG
jgi:pyruvate/2-oxoglutarate dehydrogenase complex dihydrolipoamide acyltransferase (E2) component